MAKKAKGERTVLAFDFGTISIGVAVGTELTGTASMLPALKAVDGIPNAEELDRLFAEWKPDIIVVGLPLNMDGTEGERAKNARAFAAMLERRTGLKVILHDERLTTVEADEILADNGVAKADRKKTLDQVAAVLILEDYLNGRNGNDNFHG